MLVIRPARTALSGQSLRLWLRAIPDGVRCGRETKIRGMGFYQNQLFPRVQDKIMARKSTRSVRARVCDSLEGAVVEVGLGSGLNASYCPAASQ